MSFKSIEAGWFTIRNSENGNFLSRDSAEKAPNCTYWDIEYESDITLAHRFSTQSEARAFMAGYCHRHYQVSVVYVTVSFESPVS